MMETLCALPLVASLAFCQPVETAIFGYVEGEYVRLAPIETARITSIDAVRGDAIEAGAPLVRLETTDAEIAERDAQAKLDQARADLANLRLGRRAEEIAVLEAALTSAKAQALDAERALARREELFARGFSPQAELDEARTARDVAEARVAETAANLDVARLPAREDEIDAAQSRVEQAQAALDQARWRLAQRTLAAPARGRVADVVRHVGEVAGPSAPALLFLPEGAVKLKLYVPQSLFRTLALDAPLDVACDGCPPGLTARITYIADEPEFTPPVIYSNEARHKLVYLVEARPDAEAARSLRPGQIVDAHFSGQTQ